MNISDSFVSELFSEPLAASDSKQRYTTSRTVFLHITTVFEIMADFFTCTAVMFVACAVQLGIDSSAMHSLHRVFSISASAGLFAAVLLQGKRINRDWTNLHPIGETARAVRLSLQALIIILPASFLLRSDIPRVTAALGFILMPFALALQKRVFASAIQRLYSQTYGVDRVVIYGAEEEGRRMASAFVLSPRLALRPITVVDEDPKSIDDCRLELSYVGRPGIVVQCASLNTEFLKSLQCNLLVIAKSNLSHSQRSRLTEIAAKSGARVAHFVAPSIEEIKTKECIEINGLLLTEEKGKVIPGYYARSKQIVDLITSSILLLLLSPVFLLIALLIRLGSCGPAIFVQKRVGRDGSLFNMYKFRSMSSQAKRYERSPDSSSDPRITKIGRFLRRTSLDELPQLINVLRGDMSLVGPRPEMPFVVRQYSAHQQQRLQVIPGITGLWQLSADRAYPIHENLHHDLSYIRQRSFSFDLAILIHTLFFAMRGGI